MFVRARLVAAIGLALIAAAAWATDERLGPPSGTELFVKPPSPELLERYLASRVGAIDTSEPLCLTYDERWLRKYATPAYEPIFEEYSSSPDPGLHLLVSEGLARIRPETAATAQAQWLRSHEACEVCLGLRAYFGDVRNKLRMMPFRAKVRSLLRAAMKGSRWVRSDDHLIFIGRYVVDGKFAAAEVSFEVGAGMIMAFQQDGDRWRPVCPLARLPMF